MSRLAPAAPPQSDRLVQRIREGLGDRPVVLVGMMGAGKTSVGKRLALKLDLPFVDADSEIERAAGLNIPEIFARHGEAAFRDGERRVIARLLADGAGVIATGGGAYMNADTRAGIARRGVSLWLKADFDVLMKRVRRRSNRPLLRNPEPEATLQRLIDDRYPVYGLADIVIHSREVAHDVIVEEAITAIAAFLDQPDAARA